MATLFERLGGREGIERIVGTVVEAHLQNPTIAKRFQPLTREPDRMKVVTGHLCDFLDEGSGGTARYAGKSMPDAHFGMNVSGEEFLAATDDIMQSLERHDVDEATRKDVLFIVYSLKPQIVGL
ncbi:MAG: group 1 truncated hemoglobin [Myxococcales bacterium]|jgi:hemoglobin